MSLAKEIGKRIRMLRLAHGMSQRELAEQANIDSKHLGRIERASAGENPTIGLIEAIANALGCDVVELFPPSRKQPKFKAIPKKLISSCNHTLDESEISLALQILNALLRHAEEKNR